MQNQKNYILYSIIGILIIGIAVIAWGQFKGQKQIASLQEQIAGAKASPSPQTPQASPTPAASPAPEFSPSAVPSPQPTTDDTKYLKEKLAKMQKENQKLKENRNDTPLQTQEQNNKSSVVISAPAPQPTAVTLTVLSGNAELPDKYYYQKDNVQIDEAQDGYVILTDGAKYRISPDSQSKTNSWISLDEVSVTANDNREYPQLIINVDRGEQAPARFIGNR